MYGDTSENRIVISILPNKDRQTNQVVIAAGAPVKNGYSWQTRQFHFSLSVEYTDRGMPQPRRVIWLDDVRHCEVTADEVSQKTGVQPDVLAALERSRKGEAVAACNAAASHVQRGRDHYNALSLEDQDAMNEYAFRTEGHTL